MGQLGAHIGGGGSDQHQIGAAGQGDVLHLVGEIPVKGIHHGAVPGELLEGEGRDELGGVLCQDHLHMAVLFDQGGGQGGGLIGGDAARDPKKNCFSAEHKMKTSLCQDGQSMRSGARGALPRGL